jgi:redox-sensitive bicupin YhaK (pirin superfamily)
MKRSKFLKSSILGLASLSLIKVKAEETTDLDTSNLSDPNVGFNHLPSQKPINMKNSILIKASDRGHANHGWLDTHHTFSFANYYNPDRMHFGVLRVINDDYIAAGAGFGTHPHENMEIITIPFEGDLEHKDSMGNGEVIKNGDVQVMSAGTGIYHSEYNANKDRAVKLFQIWVFPNKRNVEPRYDQITLDTSKMDNRFMQILSPNPKDEGVWIHQNAWFDMGKFEKGVKINHQLRAPKTNGVYAMVVDGKFKLNGQDLDHRDGLGIWDIENLNIETIESGRLLLMEVPMQMNS